MSWMCYKSFNLPNSGQWNHSSSVAQVLGIHSWCCRYVTEGNTYVSRKTRYVSILWCSCLMQHPFEHQTPECVQSSLEVAEFSTRWDNWIFERVLLYNCFWTYADIISGDYLRVCILTSVPSSFMYKTTRNNKRI
jgi:hypothetical protein